MRLSTASQVFFAVEHKSIGLAVGGQDPASRRHVGCGGQQVELSEEPALWEEQAGSVVLAGRRTGALAAPSLSSGLRSQEQGRCGRSGQEASGPCHSALPLALEDSLNVFVVVVGRG